MLSVRHIKAVFFVITDVKRTRTLKRNDHERTKNRQYQGNVKKCPTRPAWPFTSSSN